MAAHGADPVGAGHACVGYLTLPLAGDALAHVHVNWLSPTKVRTTLIGGSERMIVWDDLNPSQRISVYDRGRRARAAGRGEPRSGPRSPTGWATWSRPPCPRREALQGVVGRARRRIREGRAPLHRRSGRAAGPRAARGREPQPRAGWRLHRTGRGAAMGPAERGVRIDAASRAAGCSSPAAPASSARRSSTSCCPTTPAEIVILDDFTRGRWPTSPSAAVAPAAVTVVEGDIRDIAAGGRGHGRASTCVFHQAAIRITQCAEEPRLALEVLADGTFNVLEAAVARRRRPGRRRVVGVGLRPGRRAAHRRDPPPVPQRHDLRRGQGRSTRACCAASTQMYGLDYVALRYFNVYGPRMDIYGVYTEVLVRWMERIEAGEPPLILGDGAQTMDFVQVHDIARANVLAAATPHVGEVFNVASGTSTSLAELAAALSHGDGSARPGAGARARAGHATACGRGWPTSPRPATCRLHAPIDLRDGLADLVAWWRADNGPRCRCEPGGGHHW